MKLPQPTSTSTSASKAKNPFLNVTASPPIFLLRSSNRPSLSFLTLKYLSYTPGPSRQQLAAPPNQLRQQQSIALAPQTFNYSSSHSLGFDTAPSTYIKRAHRAIGATSFYLNNHRCETLQTY
ncbi:hypothetical protein H9Q69_013008 [Fusarium xylarioides]|uniref:Uncharacterized protein n=1 Tax=Fusarium xylarioides TaxID=221167 RepID=A0A9P7L1L5_9HYPO|nr:hypothetical protein H9Q70_010766 [Fusarium xylarioides]KAG5761300.1 hypothetical protein H9Q72_010594 [Fusarium xylarioides]KAG5787932.1 hypothetical protein H9Q69_013008 [Fusarium xylarioides]KAG5805904.1 hypothetical protein H9Q71_009511 [Fusarium xylarioides]KAG5822966.1 hypothetical protein H9Q74_006936 [Fusarium xylarioides]